MPQDSKDEENAKILDGDGTAPKAIPEDTSAIGEDGIPLSPRDHSGVQFISPSRGSGNGDAKVDLGGVGSVPQFVGLGKEELMRYANDPFWVRLRWFLFILFWLIWLGMLAAAIAIIIMAPKCTSTTKVATNLANSGPYYQVELNALTDPDKFTELKTHVDYILGLGVKTVILSQFQNPTDLKSVDPAFGTMESLNALLTAFKDKARILLQLSPNHVPKHHTWFEKHPEYFVVKDSVEANKSTWKNRYDGKAWTPYGDGSNSYLHQFRESEADLNYEEPELVAQMNGVLKHWYNVSDGIYGFLLSDVSYLTENLQDLQNPTSGINQKANKQALENLLDSSKWELGTTRLPPYALLDVDDLDAKASMDLYTGDAMIPILTDLTNLTMNFTAEDLQSHVGSIKSHFVIRRLSSPRMKRVGSRYSQERANILAMTTFVLRGELIVYYGDEIGLKNTNVPTDATSLDVSLDRMNWNLGSGENQILHFYQCLSEVHKSINQTDVNDDSGTVYNVFDGIFAFKRDKYVVVANLNSTDIELNLAEKFPVSKNGNGTLICSTPNTGLSTDYAVFPGNFTAKPLSGYILTFAEKEK